MKPRIQTDVFFLILFVVGITACVFIIPSFYLHESKLNHLLNALGLICILKGTLLRMVARGHKKLNSNSSSALVTTGIYRLVRNPMYLGTALTGSGFVLIFGPWWGLPVFIICFYLRFRIQINKEETFLRQNFGQAYEDYCRQTPSLFPSILKAWKTPLAEIVSPKESFETKESRGLVYWPILGFILALIKEWIIFGKVDGVTTSAVFVGTAALFALDLIVLYKISKRYA